MHCAGPSGLFGREFVSVDRSVNKHSFQTCSESVPWMLRYIAELNLWSAEVLLSVRYELILIGLPLPLMRQLILSLLGIGSYSGRVSGINFGGIQFLYPTDEK